mmetsp:Transcript_30127/g.36960  ORF Transcript_30127/g.36960 Transcript_30127/m.36960 type:complete len:120 (-) Transcript_30127:51-410(-)
MTTFNDKEIIYTTSNKSMVIMASFTFFVGSYFIGNSVLNPPNVNASKQDKYHINVHRYQRFVLGTTLFGMGINFFSYYYFPYNKRNYKIQLDPIRRSGLWALFGCGVGITVGKILFLSF